MPRKLRKPKSAFLPASAQAAVRRLLVTGTGAGLLALSFILLMALVTYSPADPSWNTAGGKVQNAMGMFGSHAADFLLQGIGLASLFFLLTTFEWGLRLVKTRTLPKAIVRVCLVPVMLVVGAAAFAALPTPYSWPLKSGLGGFLGAVSLDMILPVVSNSAWALYSVAAGLMIAAIGLFLYVGGTTRAEWRMMGLVARKVIRAVSMAISMTIGTIASLIGRYGGQVLVRYIWTPIAAKLFKKPSGAKRAPSSKIKPKKQKAGLVEATPKKISAGARSQQTSLRLGDVSEFDLPSTKLLQEVPRQQGEVLSKEALEQNARLLESVLADFGINGEIVKVRPGPVVTLYELEPAPGLKSSRVIALADDIARSMSAISARVAVVPGKNAIGIELPNSDRETVYLRELLESKDYEKASGDLSLVLGKDIGGDPIIADLAKMPHLLIAGTTGSGKSVGVNTMILSLLYKMTPEQCRIILIDPKMLELSVYDGIPHLLTPVVTDPKKAVVALKWCVREMENRYRAMSKVGVRNIHGYNERIRQARKKGEELTRRVQTGFDEESGKPVYEDQPLDLQEIPQIVVVVDEMADLMLVAGKDIEAAIQRLAQMARASGIHLIMATQRPSVDVITGTIKANFPTRISFQVTSKIDSRTILGEQGGEQLLGRGDMLYMAGGGRITRVHGPFVGDDEVEGIVKFLSDQGEPEYLESVTEEDEDAEPIPGMSNTDYSGATGGNTTSDDALYDQAVAIVVRDEKASISYIQRRLKVGYNKAATLIERMEEDGIISEAQGGGKREVLASGSQRGGGTLDAA